MKLIHGSTTNTASGIRVCTSCGSSKHTVYRNKTIINMLRNLKRLSASSPSRLLDLIIVSGKPVIVPRGRTFAVQNSLPKLPVPPLEQTLRKYLETCRPFLNEDQFKSTEQIVTKFLKNEGPILQNLLEERAARETNWLSEWWKHWAYLDNRIPVVINVNPGIYLPPQNYRGQEEQVEFAAKFIAGILDYKIMLDEQKVPVETVGGRPLCMFQFYQLLGACRIPGVKRDSHVCVDTSGGDSNPRHITVIHNNHIFSMDVYGDQDKPLSVQQLLEQLHYCLSHSQKPGLPVGILTSMDRTSWGKAYTNMLKDQTTKASLESIQQSIFAVCLDGIYQTEENNSVDATTAMFLHGGGSSLYSANRWFDKTMQFIFSEDGNVGVNYEHTAAEGPAVISLCDHVLDYVQRNKESWFPATQVQSPRRLEFHINNTIQEVIGLGSSEIDSSVADLMLRTLWFKDYGKSLIKYHKLSPDAFIQMAFQLAYYRIYKQPCATYETGSLRKFQLGRTETIRSCSVSSVHFTQAMEDQSVSQIRRLDLLKQAIKAHRKYTDEAINGQGIDRHLLGLKLIALENSMNIPELYLDLSFKESTHFRLSTSQVASKFKAFLCFGPVVPDGYGICYNPQEDELIFSVTSFNNSPHTNSDTFVDCLKTALLDMQLLLLAEARL